MMGTTLSSLLRGARRLLVLAAVASGSAHAVTYSGVWDPPYGPDFPNLGWSGSALFSVPESCVPTGTALVSNNPVPFFPSVPNCGGQAEVLSAQVQLYSLSNPSLTATLNFDVDSIDIIKLQFVNGDLSQLQTTFSDLVSAPVGSWANFGVPGSVDFSLVFNLNTFLSPGGGPRLAWVDCGYERTHHCDGGINANGPGFRPTFTISRVPEPGSLWLAVLGLAALAPRARKALAAR